MKNVILSFLVFVMLLPGLACANIMNHAAAKQMTGMKNCPGMKENPSAEGGVKLFKDCAKSDLQTASDAQLFKKHVPERSGFFAPAVFNHPSALHKEGDSLSRGPPPDALSAQLHALPVFLASLRLRI